MRFFIFIILSALGFNTLAGQNSKVITDSLVENLRCDQLSVDTIYSSISKDAFSLKYAQTPRNWRFGPSLGACWALASNQRMFFYLARWGQGSLPDAATTKNILDMVRGYSVEEVQMNGRPRLVSLPLRQYQVFQTGSEQFNDAFEEHSFLKLLLNGFTEEIGGQTMERNFINDTELNQRRRFFRPGNLKYVLPGIAQSAENNKATVDLLMKNLKSNRLTLINIKSDELAQHVVLAKSFKIEKDGTILINSYDSTFDFETSIRYNPRSGQFTDAVAPIKWDWWETPSTTPESVIGVFIVGEEERAPIEQAMLRYYRDLCE